MRKWWMSGARVTLALCALWMTLGCASAPVPAPDPGASLDWMIGTWVQERPGGQIVESWLRNQPNLLIGINRVYRAKQIVFFESLRIETAEDGSVVYQASPLDREPTPFRMVEQGERRVTFENPDHDYPQRILYWLDDDGALHARIEGEENGETKSTTWTYLPGTLDEAGLE